jgi:hypothetical protein
MQTYTLSDVSSLNGLSCTAGREEDEVLMEDSLDAVCLDRRPARELSERGCSGRSGSLVGIAGTSGMSRSSP